MSVFLRQIQHLLPRSRTWALGVDRTLRRLFSGIAQSNEAHRDFIDDVHDDIWPPTTRELTEWETQHGIVVDALASDEERRAGLDAEWKAQGGQSLFYIETSLQAAGFDVYVHPYWVNERAAGELAGASYNERTLDAAASGGVLSKGMALGNRGTKLYTVGTTTDAIIEWDLSTAYKLDTATDSGKSLTVTAQDTLPFSLQFAPDGLTLFVLGATNHQVFQYTLTTAWDLSTASYASKVSLDMSSQDGDPTSLYLRPDGLAYFIAGQANGTIYEYTLTTAWDISTAAYSGNSYDVQTPTSGTSFDGLEFLKTGTRFIAAMNGTLYQFSMGTAWDLSTAVYDSVSLNTAESAGKIADIRFGGRGGENAVGYDSGSKLFVIDFTDDVYEYSLSSYEPRNPNDYLANPLIGSWTMGDTKTFQGVYPVGTVNVDVVFSSETDNDVDYIVNLDRTTRAPPKLPTDPDFYQYFFYVGGETFGTDATVADRRRAEFERLLLRVRPNNQWIGLFINYSAELSTEGGALLRTEAGGALFPE